MAHRGISIRYLAAKLAASAEAAAMQMQSSATTSLTEVIAKGMEAFRRELTGVGIVTGVAMAPTLNADALTKSDAMEKFIMRLIPRPAAQRTIFDGDVVAFTSPLVSPGAAEQVIVRRIAALEGDELVTEDAEDNDNGDSYTIPAGYCWVLADNENLTFPDVIDSRSFGPLPLTNIIGRVMYAARSETDHGPIENSEEGMESDAAVLEAELDLEKLCGTADTEEEN